MYMPNKNCVSILHQPITSMTHHVRNLSHKYVLSKDLLFPNRFPASKWQEWQQQGYKQSHLSLVKRKPVYGVCDKVSLKQAAATETT